MFSLTFSYLDEIIVLNFVIIGSLVISIVIIIGSFVIVQIFADRAWRKCSAAEHRQERGRLGMEQAHRCHHSTGKYEHAHDYNQVGLVWNIIIQRVNMMMSMVMIMMIIMMMVMMMSKAGDGANSPMSSFNG